MINQSNKVLNTNITKLVNKPYQYGFSTNIEKDIIEKGLNEQTSKSHRQYVSNIFREFSLVAPTVPGINWHSGQLSSLSSGNSHSNQTIAPNPHGGFTILGLCISD